jgi:hypothetical protein
MLSFVHGGLLFSFNKMWITNQILNPNLDLRKTDDLNVPGHKVAISATTLSTFRRIWNADDYQCTRVVT